MSPLLMRHFTQALDGIGALSHLGSDFYRVRRDNDVITEIANRYTASAQVWWVRVGMSDGTGYRGGRLLVEVTYERVTWDDVKRRQRRYPTSDYYLFSNPIKAAEYVASLFGYAQPALCSCAA